MPEPRLLRLIDLHVLHVLLETHLGLASGFGASFRVLGLGI